MTEQKWWIECGAFIPNSTKFTRNHLMPTEQVNKFRFKWNNTGVFTTAYIYDNKDREDANLYGDFYIDLDYEIEDSTNQEDAFNIVRQEAIQVIKYLKVVFGVEVQCLKTYFSGSKGIHIIVPKEVFNIEPHKNLNMIFRMMAEDIKKLIHSETLDLKVYDKVRLWRMPNSAHQKTNLYKIPLSQDELATMSFSDVKSLASTPRAEVKSTPVMSHRASMEYRTYIKKLELMLNKPRPTGMLDTKLDYTPPCIEHILNSPVGKGQRNETLAVLASFLRQSGHSEDQALATINQWNDRSCTPPIDDSELLKTTDSIYKGQHKMGCAKARLISKCDGDICKLHKKGN